MAADGSIPVLAFAPAGLADIDLLIDDMKDERNWFKGGYRHPWRYRPRCPRQAMRDFGVAYLEPAILVTANEGRVTPYQDIPHFNDHRDTDHALVMATLRKTRENILSGKIVVHVPTVNQLRSARRQKIVGFFKWLGSAFFNAMTFMHRDLIDGNI